MAIVRRRRKIAPKFDFINKSELIELRRWSSLKPGPAGTRKNSPVITAVVFYLSIFAARCYA